MSNVKTSVAEFWNDEDGMETLQTVMIAGVAAVITIVIIAFWSKIKTWAKDLLQQVQDDSEAQKTP
jgi:Flp pilus assembly pilin Flp